MAITAAMVGELRAKTDAPMMECKKALEETDGNMDLAIEELRKKSALKAAKKAGRTTADGLLAVRVADDGKRAAGVDRRRAGVTESTIGDVRGHRPVRSGDHRQDAVGTTTDTSRIKPGRHGRRPARLEELVTAGLWRGPLVDVANVAFGYDAATGRVFLQESSPMWRPQ